MEHVKLNSRNQITVPKEARESLGLAPGDDMLLKIRGKTILLCAVPADVLRELRGSARGVYGDVDAYLRRERGSWRGGGQSGGQAGKC